MLYNFQFSELFNSFGQISQEELENKILMNVNDIVIVYSLFTVF